MKSAIVIKSFCNSQEKLDVLVEAIEKIRSFSDLPILIHAGWPIPIEISSKVQFYIQYDNSGLTSGNNHRWKRLPGYSGEFRSQVSDYGLADAMQLKVCASFLADFGYNIIHVFNYDVDIDQIIELDCYNQNVNLLNNGYEAAYQQSRDNYAGLLFYSINIDAFNSKVSHALTLETWHSDFYNHWPFVAENGFYEIFSRLNSVVTHHNFQLNDLISTGWLDTVGFNLKLSSIIEEGGIYSANNGVYVFALHTNKPLIGKIIFNSVEIFELNGTLINTYELSEYPEKVTYLSDTGEETDVFEQYKLDRMKNNLYYYDAELSL
jgi:hypothetical protein